MISVNLTEVHVQFVYTYTYSTVCVLLRLYEFVVLIAEIPSSCFMEVRKYRTVVLRMIRKYVYSCTVQYGNTFESTH